MNLSLYYIALFKDGELVEGIDGPFFEWGRAWTVRIGLCNNNQSKDYRIVEAKIKVEDA